MVVGGFDDRLVVFRPTGLDDGLDARLRGPFDTIREREEGVGGHHRSLGSLLFGVFLGFHGRQAHRVDAGDLPHPDPDRLRPLREENCVRLDVFDRLPGKEQRLDLLVGRFAVRDDRQVPGGDRLEVPLLDQAAADESLLGESVGSLAQAPDVEHPEVVLRTENFERALGVAGRDDDRLERVDDPLGGGGVTLAVQGDDPAEGAHRIRRQRSAVGLREPLGRRTPGRVGVLDDRRGRLCELLDQVECGVGVVVVVVRQPLRTLVELVRADDTRLVDGVVGVHRCLLVWVLAVPQVGGPVVGEDASGGELAAVVAVDSDGLVLVLNLDAPLGEPLDCPRVRLELPPVEDTILQGRGRVALVDRHRLLGHDWAGVDLRLDNGPVLVGRVGHDVDGTAGHGDAGIQRVAPGLCPRKGG